MAGTKGTTDDLACVEGVDVGGVVENVEVGGIITRVVEPLEVAVEIPIDVLKELIEDVAFEKMLEVMLEEDGKVVIEEKEDDGKVVGKLVTTVVGTGGLISVLVVVSVDEPDIVVNVSV